MGLNLGICEQSEKDGKKKVILEYLMTHIKVSYGSVFCDDRKTKMKDLSHQDLWLESFFLWNFSKYQNFFWFTHIKTEIHFFQRHNSYVIRYFVCEALCLLNIVVQLYLMNKFFDGEFLSYGLKVMDYSEVPQEDRIDPMVYVFPRVTKCTFHKYGPSGSIQKHDSMCILPLNIVNEKTYIFIWFWFMILATLLSILIIYRITILAFPKLRPRILHAKNRAIPLEICQALTRKVDLGDWWILLMMGTNMDPLIYREIISELAKKIDSDQ